VRRETLYTANAYDRAAVDSVYDHPAYCYRISRRLAGEQPGLSGGGKQVGMRY